MVVQHTIRIAAAALLVSAAPAAAQQAGGGQARPRAGGIAVFTTEPSRAATQTSGRYGTREGLRLRMNVDIGSVKVTTIPGASEVTVTMRVETDPRQPDTAKLLRQVSLSGSSTPEGVNLTSAVPWSEFRGRLWVRFEITTPRNYNLEVATHAGDISVDDVEGHVVLTSHGGNVTAGNISGNARLETNGGHVAVRNVGGDLSATTGGGHITAGVISGTASVHTAGGHVHVAWVKGMGTAETGGGDIAVGKAGGKFTAVSEGGGQITFAEASGAIEARTAGGGIRVLRMAGPMQLSTAAGSIYLTQVSDAVRATTASGNITAWFAGEGKKKAASQLQCSEGDIVVYLPRQLALNIEAIIEDASNHQVTWDPAIPIKLMSAPRAAAGRRVIRATGTVNGGGETLRLRTVGGNIRLMYVEPGAAEAYRAQVENFERQFQVHTQDLQDLHKQFQVVVREQENEKKQIEVVEQSRIEALRAMLAELFARPVRVDPAEQKEKLTLTVIPVYPEAAKRQKVEGIVQLEALLSEDGKVAELRTLSGHPLLVQAAREAVLQWQYAPTYSGKRPVKVITRIDVQFRMN